MMQVSSFLLAGFIFLAADLVQFLQEAERQILSHVCPHSDNRSHNVCIERACRQTGDIHPAQSEVAVSDGVGRMLYMYTDDFL